MPKLKERVRIAREIEKAQHAVKKSKHEKSWLQETAEAMDIDIDPDMMYVSFPARFDTFPHAAFYLLSSGRLKNQTMKLPDPGRRPNSGCVITRLDYDMNLMSCCVNP